MATEEQIKELAHTLWEQEGRPDGKDMEHYFRAEQILLEQERMNSPLLVSDPPPMSDISPTAPPPLVKPRNKPRPKKTR